MTSKISCSKLFGRELRQFTWLAAVQTVLYLLLIPFRVLLSMSASSTHNLTAAQKLNNLCLQIGIDRFENVLVVLAAGIVCALCVFSYVHSPVKTDLYHSISIKREKLFAVKYAVGFVTFAVPYTIAQILGVLTGALYGGFTPMLVPEMAVCILQQILFFLCSYSGTILAVMMTGKIVTSVLAVAVLIGYIPMFWMLGVTYAEYFLNTSMQISSLVNIGTENALRYSSPWAFCILWGSGPEVSGISYGLTGRWPSVTGLCELTAIFVVVTLIALALYRNRKSEVAGSALAFVRLEGVVKVLLAVPAALIAALIARELHSVVWEAVFIVLFASLGCMIMEFIYRWDIHMVFRHREHILISAVLAAVIFFPIRYDALGYNTYLPGKEDIESMAMQDLYSTYTYEETQEADNQGKKKTDGQKGLDYLECDKIDLLYPLAQNGVEYAKKSLKMDETYDGDTTYVNMKYHLKDGKEVYRCYEVDEKLYTETMEKLFQDSAYKEKYYPILTMEATDIYQIVAECYEENFPELMRYYPASAASAISYADDGTEMESAEEAGTEAAAEEMATEERTTESAAQTAQEEKTEAAGAAETESESEEDFWSEIEVTDGTYTDYGVQIAIPQAEKAKFLAAYQKDLREISYDKLDATMNSLQIQLQSQRQTFECDRYPLSNEFKNTVRVLEEITKEYGTADALPVYG